MEARGVGSWAWLVPFDAVSVRVGRMRATEALRALGVEEVTVDDARVVLGELLANAVRHARPRSDGRVLISLDIDEASVSVSVADGGSASVPTLAKPPMLATSGRGLGIVHTPTRSWGVREAPEGNVVFGVLSRV